MSNTQTEIRKKEWEKKLREWIYWYNRNEEEANWITERQSEWLIKFITSTRKEAYETAYNDACKRFKAREATLLEMEREEAVKEVIEKIDNLIQHPPNVSGDNTVCIDLDVWEKLIKALKSEGGK